MSRILNTNQLIEGTYVRIINGSHTNKIGYVWRVWLDGVTVQVMTSKGLVSLDVGDIEIM